LLTPRSVLDAGDLNGIVAKRMGELSKNCKNATAANEIPFYVAGQLFEDLLAGNVQK